jgi:translation initiation factor 2 alpha subunit (eIF-2alpha)
MAADAMRSTISYARCLVGDATRKLRSQDVEAQLKMVQSPQFKQQMADMQRQTTKATLNMETQQIQREIQILQQRLSTLQEPSSHQ